MFRSENIWLKTKKCPYPNFNWVGYPTSLKWVG